ncbi:hypothetical protein DL93DRAFT_2081032 [Clavulina sp. PMI_390]|nr:hypothetical protein DL93DRAFT_2081032 [Clavulina sp. PMI_390]
MLFSYPRLLKRGLSFNSLALVPSTLIQSTVHPMFGPKTESFKLKLLPWKYKKYATNGSRQRVITTACYPSFRFTGFQPTGSTKMNPARRIGLQSRL